MSAPWSANEQCEDKLAALADRYAIGPLAGSLSDKK